MSTLSVSPAWTRCQCAVGTRIAKNLELPSAPSPNHQPHLACTATLALQLRIPAVLHIDVKKVTGKKTD